MTGWQTKTLKDATDLIKDGTHGTHKDVENGTPLLSAKDIKNGKVNLVINARKISSADFNSIHKSYKLQDNDILLTIVGSLGRVAIVQDYNDNYTLQRSVAILRFSNEINPAFGYYTLTSSDFQKELMKRESKGAQGGVYLGDISKIKIQIPQKPEQERIVAVLKTWDEYIEKLEQKIALKKQMKKGLIQQLLNQPSSDQKNLTIADIFDFLPTYSHSKAEMTYAGGDNESIYCIHYGDIHTKFNSYIEIDRMIVPHLLTMEQISRSRLLREGDVVVTDASEDYEGVGSSIEIKNLMGRKCIAGLHTFALRPKKELVATGYGTLIFRDSNVHRSLMKIATYSKVYGVTKTSFAQIKITLPSLADQYKIVGILSTLDNEISDMNTKKWMVLLQKKYLLKNLITGTIRTPETLTPKGTK